jgi:hypothetical protein
MADKITWADRINFKTPLGALYEAAADIYNSLKHAINAILSSFNNIYYVKTTGDDAAAEVNNPRKPYKTIKAAALAAYTDQQATNNWNQVYVFEGVYNEYDIAQPEIEMYFEDWAIVWYANEAIISDWRYADKRGEYTIKGNIEAIRTDGYSSIEFSYAETSAIVEGKAANNITGKNNVTTEIGLNMYFKNFHIYGYSEIQKLTDSIVYDNCIFDQPYACIVEGADSTLNFKRCKLNIDAVYATTKTKEIRDKAGNLVTTVTLNPTFNDTTPLDVSVLTNQQVIDTLTIANWPNGGTTAAFQIDSNNYTGGDRWVKSKILFEDCSFIVHSEKYLAFRASQYLENVSTYIKLKGCRFINKSGVGGQSGFALLNNGLQTFNKNITIEIDGLVYSGIDNEYATSSSNTSFGTHQIEDKLSKTDTAKQSMEGALEVKGNLSSDTDKSATAGDLDYVQKKYMDGRIFANTDKIWPFEKNINPAGSLTLEEVEAFFVDMYLQGEINDAKEYSAATIKRNDSGVWQISIYEETPVQTGTPTIFNLVCQYITTDNPESSGVSIHILDEQNSSGISGKIAVDWSKISNGAYFNLWASGSFGYKLDDNIFDKNYSTYINNSNPAPEKLDIDDFADGQVLSYEHPQGDVEQEGDSTYVQNGVGCYFPVDSSIQFNEIRVRAGSSGDNTLTYIRIYKTNSTPSSFIPDTDAQLLEELTQVWDANEKHEKKIKLNNTYTADIGDVIFILYATKTSIETGQNRWFDDPNNDRLLIYFSVSTDYENIFSDTWFRGSSTFWATPPIALVTSPFVENTTARITIPENIIAVVGTELTLQYDALIMPSDQGVTSPKNYNVEITCDVGVMRERNYQLTPTGGDIGDHRLTIKVFDRGKKVVDCKNVTLTIINNAAPVAVTNGLMIGDSITVFDAARITTTVRNNFVALGSNIPVFWGNNGASPNNHEGNSGYAYKGYATDTGSNPFWNAGGLDIANYRNNLGMGATLFDWVTIQLGVNDSFTNYEQSVYEINETIGYAVDIVDAFLADNPSTKIMIMIPTSDGNTKGGWGENYGALSSKEIYQINIWKLREAIINKFDKAAYSANVSVGIPGLVCDRYYGYERTNQAVSSRISETEEVHINAVHPYTPGFEQIADSIYPQILANI